MGRGKKKAKGYSRGLPCTGRRPRPGEMWYRGEFTSGPVPDLLLEVWVCESRSPNAGEVMRIRHRSHLRPDVKGPKRTFVDTFTIPPTALPADFGMHMRPSAVANPIIRRMGFLGLLRTMRNKVVHWNRESDWASGIRGMRLPGYHAGTPDCPACLSLDTKQEVGGEMSTCKVCGLLWKYTTTNLG